MPDVCQMLPEKWYRKSACTFMAAVKLSTVVDTSGMLLCFNAFHFKGGPKVTTVKAGADM